MSTHPSRVPQILRILLAGLCVLLVLFVGVAQVLHTHPATEAADPGCSLCAVAHLSIVAPVVSDTPVAVELTASVPLSDVSRASSRLVFFNTYVRPPPVLTPRS